MTDRPLLDQQIAYYRARANEYDEWFLRQGRYDRGPEHRRRWVNEIEHIESVLRSTIHDSEVLELACGTGLWTRRLAENNPRIIAVDTSPEVIAINRARVGEASIDYRLADIFSLEPAETFDAVFFSFWLSHVPEHRFESFWKMVRTALKPGGRAFFIDGRAEQTSTALDHDLLDDSGMDRRRLNDGREFDIVKIFYDPPALERRLAAIGWQGWVRSTDTFFLYGCVTPSV